MIDVGWKCKYLGIGGWKLIYSLLTNWTQNPRFCILYYFMHAYITLTTNTVILRTAWESGSLELQTRSLLAQEKVYIIINSQNPNQTISTITIVHSHQESGACGGGKNRLGCLLIWKEICRGHNTHRHIHT